MSPVRDDGGFDLIDTNDQQIISPAEWKKIYVLIEQGKEEEARELLLKLAKKHQQNGEQR